MAFFVVYHGVNGFRIAYNDLFRTELWAKTSTRRAYRLRFIITFVLWLPALGIMGYSLLKVQLWIFRWRIKINMTIQTQSVARLQKH